MTNSNLDFKNSEGQRGYISKENDSDNNIVKNNSETSLLDYDDELAPRNLCERWFGPIREGSLRGSTLAMASITFGGGCLAFPSAIKNTGCIMGLIIFIIVAAISYWTLVILMNAGIKTKNYDYNNLILKSMGKKFVTFSDVNNLILCIGVIMSYQKFIYEFALSILEAFFGVKQDDKNVKIYVILICFILIQIPLTCLKKIAFLQYVSIIGSLALIYSIIVIIAKTYSKFLINKDLGIKLFMPIDLNYLNSISIFLFGFCSHNGVFQIFVELNRPTKERYSKVLNRSFMLEIALYSLISFSGYFSFLSTTRDNILSNYDPNDNLILISKIALFICLHCSLAINYNIMRLSYKSMLLADDSKHFPFFKDLGLAFATLLISNIVVYFVENVSTILGIVGGISTVVISYFNPIMIHILNSGKPKSATSNLLALLILIFVSLIGIAATIYSIYDFIDKLVNPKMF